MLVLSRFFSVRNGRAAEQSPAKHEAEASIVRARGNEREAVARFFSVPWADQGVPDGLAHIKLDRLDWGGGGGRRGVFFHISCMLFYGEKESRVVIECSCGIRQITDCSCSRMTV